MFGYCLKSRNIKIYIKLPPFLQEMKGWDLYRSALQGAEIFDSPPPMFIQYYILLYNSML